MLFSYKKPNSKMKRRSAEQSMMKLCRKYVNYKMYFDFNNSNVLSVQTINDSTVAVDHFIVSAAYFAAFYKDFIMYFYFICLNKQRLFWYDLKIIFFFFIAHRVYKSESSRASRASIAAPLLRSFAPPARGCPPQAHGRASGTDVRPERDAARSKCQRKRMFTNCAERTACTGSRGTPHVICDRRCRYQMAAVRRSRATNEIERTI